MHARAPQEALRTATMVDAPRVPGCRPRASARHGWLFGVAFALAATSAWAVAGKVSIAVSDPAGRPVAGAKISLGGVTVTTDGSGQATVEVEEGSHVLNVQHDEFVEHDEVVSVPAGGTSVAVQLESRAAAGSGPVVVAGSPMGSRVPISVNARTDQAETPKQSGSTTETITVDGEVVFSETTQDDTAAENELLRSETRVDSTEIEIAVALRGRGGPAAELALGGGVPGAPFFAALQQPGGGATSEDPERRFLPVLSLAVGQADVELEVNGRQDPSIRNRFTEKGTMWGGGLDLIWMLCDDCGWHLGLGYRFRTVEDLDTERQPRRAVEGATTLEDSATLEFESHQAHVFVGHGWSRVALYGGVRLNRREVTLAGRQVFDFSAFYGFPVEDVVEFRTELEAESEEALLGLMFRFGDSDLYGRLEASSDGDDETATAGLTWAWGSRR